MSTIYSGNGKLERMEKSFEFEVSRQYRIGYSWYIATKMIIGTWAFRIEDSCTKKYINDYKKGTEKLVKIENYYLPTRI